MYLKLSINLRGYAGYQERTRNVQLRASIFYVITKKVRFPLTPKPYLSDPINL